MFLLFFFALKILYFTDSEKRKWKLATFIEGQPEYGQSGIIFISCVDGKPGM